MLSLRRALTSYLTSGWSTSVDLDRYSKALCTCKARLALRLLHYLCCLTFVALTLLQYVTVKIGFLVSLTGMHKQAALERPDLSCTYLAHYKLKSTLLQGHPQMAC